MAEVVAVEAVEVAEEVAVGVDQQGLGPPPPEQLEPITRHGMEVEHLHPLPWVYISDLLESI